MKQERLAAERGVTRMSWLESYHTFSFGEYHDPEYMGFRSLRVINDDYLAPGGGFGTHPHKNMEIITYVLSGALEHKDSMGNGEVLHAGELQRMSAGKGILHSEFNHSKTEPVHLLQIWIEPAERGLTPSYEQRSIEDLPPGVFMPVVSGDLRQGTMKMNQDAVISLAKLEPKSIINQPLDSARHYWLHLALGAVIADGTTLKAGDALAISDEIKVSLQALEASQLLLFELA